MDDKTSSNEAQRHVNNPKTTGDRGKIKVNGGGTIGTDSDTDSLYIKINIFTFYNVTLITTYD